jgi:nucleolar protein 4
VSFALCHACWHTPCFQQIERALKRAPLQDRKQKRRQAAEQEDAEAGADAGPDAPAAQQQQQPGTKPKKPPPPAGEQPPPKRQKTAQQQQQQQQSGAPAGTASDKHKWLRTVALGVPNPGAYLQVAQKFAAACGGLVEVLDPAPADVTSKAHLAQDGCSGHVVFLVYDNVSAAREWKQLQWLLICMLLLAC